MQTKVKKIIGGVFYYDRSELIFLNLFWIGFILYVAGWTLSTTKQVNFVLCQLVQMFGMVLLIPSWAKLVKLKFDNEYQKIIFILLLTWSISIFIRGLFDIESLNDVKGVLFNPWFGGLFYFAPLVMLFPKKLIYYKKIFDVVIILAVIYILYDLRFISNLMEPDGENELSRDIVEYFSKTLGFPVIFILLTYVYHTRPRVLFSAIVFLVIIFFSMVRARRGMLAMAIGPLAIVYLLYMINSRRKVLAGVISLSVITLIISGFFLYIYTNESIEIFDLLEERGTGDTRSGVERNFYNSMEGIDWVIGRGMLGEYYSPSIAGSNYRGTIETDFLNMILKGGYINVILLLLILVPAMINGIFRSKNTLAKASGFWILYWMLSTYPATVQVFTLYYLLVWFAVGICYSSTMRNMPESALKVYFQSKGNIRRNVQN